MTRLITLALSTAPFAIATAAGAQFHAQDIGLGLVDNQIGFSDASTDDQGNILYDARVFGFPLRPDATETDPGFDSLLNVFNPQADLGYQFVSPLRKWDGENFDTIPAERIRMTLGPAFGVLTPLEDEVLQGVTVSIGSDGRFHHHYRFRLLLDDAPATSESSFGVYLLPIQFFDASGFHETSETSWLVIEHQADEGEYDAAIAFANANFPTPAAPACPADINGDGIITGVDFTDFITEFSLGSDKADLNGDGIVSGVDFTDFITAFGAGCP